MTLAQARKRKRQIDRDARELLRQLSDDTTAKDVQDIENRYDVLMEERDELVDKIDDLLDARALDPKTMPPPVQAGPIIHTDGDDVQADAWRDVNSGREVRVVGHSESLADDEPDDQPRVGAIMRSMLFGAKSEAETRALSVGTDSAGGFTVSDILTRQFIDRLRARSRVFQAGAQTLEMPSGTVNVARVSTDPTPGWRAENASVAESEPAVTRVQFNAQSLAVLFQVSRELLEDSVNVEQILESVLTSAMASEVDRAALYGSGSSNEPTGIKNLAGITTPTSMGANGNPLDSYVEILAALQALAEANANPPTAMIMAPRTRYTIAGLVDTTGQPLRAPEIVSQVPMMDTAKSPIDETQGTATDASSIILGDFTQLVVGVRTQLTIRLLQERYADKLQVGFLAYLRADVQALQPKAFTAIEGITP